MTTISVALIVLSDPFFFTHLTCWGTASLFGIYVALQPRHDNSGNACVMSLSAFYQISLWLAIQSLCSGGLRQTVYMPAPSFATVMDFAVLHESGLNEQKGQAGIRVI